MIKVYLPLAMVLIAPAADAAHIVTQTRQAGAVVGETHTYANAAGDLRIDEHRGGELRESTLYQQEGQAIVSLEGRICRKLSVADMPPAPPAQRRRGGRFGEALGKAGAAIEKAMEEASRDMSAEEQRAMREFMGGRVPEDLTYEVRAAGGSMEVNGYRAEGYEVVDSRGRVVQRLWMTPTKKLRGSAEVRKAMEGMMETYRAFAERMGGAGAMDDSMAAAFTSAALRNQYPVRIEDLEADEVTDVVTTGSGDADYYPDCEERSMFGM